MQSNLWLVLSPPQEGLVMFGRFTWASLMVRNSIYQSYILYIADDLLLQHRKALLQHDSIALLGEWISYQFEEESAKYHQTFSSSSGGVWGQDQW